MPASSRHPGDRVLFAVTHRREVMGYKAPALRLEIGNRYQVYLVDMNYYGLISPDGSYTYVTLDND